MFSKGVNFIKRDLLNTTIPTLFQYIKYINKNVPLGPDSVQASLHDLWHFSQVRVSLFITTK